MRYTKLCGVLQEIVEQAPNIDVADVLERELAVSRFKAEDLAARIQKKQVIEYSIPEPKRLFEQSAQADLKDIESVYTANCLGEKEFEHFMNWLLKELGYSVVSVESQDWGVDFVVVGAGAKIAVNAIHCPKTHCVSDSIVLLSQQARLSYGCSRSIVVATGCFTGQALKDAQESGVELWDNGTLQKKVGEVTRKDEGKAQSRFPVFQGTLVASLLRLGETKDFRIEAKAGGKYDVHLPGIKYPLLTFQVNDDAISRCVYRIRYYEPVAESEGETLVDIDNGLNPDPMQVYASITQYLEQFLG